MSTACEGHCQYMVLKGKNVCRVQETVLCIRTDITKHPPEHSCSKMQHSTVGQRFSSGPTLKSESSKTDTKMKVHRLQPSKIRGVDRSGVYKGETKGDKATT
ncbi:hypothetical protein TGARI_366290 [Toxoplasma gondii ARI]|uniref:Uncharacterized protein n=2 Tax=Toxoplasma gondii TaxID=5811 RepID=A0A2T6IEC5_TOXGO|nr:hypothetical protein TGARI_366290 [Toxoplasma gondii ARI]PUA83688.1 hypothetical protein TGBR9_366290 [Toxoplasma gondii TgCATBr9]